MNLQGGKKQVPHLTADFGCGQKNLVAEVLLASLEDAKRVRRYNCRLMRRDLSNFVESEQCLNWTEIVGVNYEAFRERVLSMMGEDSDGTDGARRTA